MDQRALKDLDITGLTADSRAVQPGFLFAALPGASQDGREYIDDALRRGATAVLAPPGTNLATKGTPEASDYPAGVRLITDSNPRRRFALMAARFFGAQPRMIAAVTGTNGKTSVAHFTQQIWSRLGYQAGYLGTLGAISPGLRLEGSLTTPDPAKLHTLLADMAARGVSHLAMEASSHGLHQFRIDGVKVAVAGFTNMTRDHLDYHGSMAAYMAAKLRLFSDVLVPGGTAVLNADSSECAAFEIACRLRGHRLMTYGKSGEALRVVNVEIDGAAQVLDLVIFEKEYRLRLPLAGTFQIGNALCALGLALAAGADRDTAVAALEHLEGVPGRLERVAATADGAPIYVDYAHTPDALDAVLRALRPHAVGRLVVVFGCGGDRDKGKRRVMGEATARLADTIYVTDDNPRSENAQAIRRDVMLGCPDAVEIADRAEAIALAVQGLGAGDVLLVAGKGHETGQIIGSQIIPFNDGDTVRNIIGASSRHGGRS